MPDWREIARRRLTPLALDAKRQEEIITELANHLEDLYEDLLRQGKSEVEAVQSALSAAADWDELRRAIQHAAKEEVVMHYRLKTLWLPGVCTSVLSSVLLQWFQRVSPTPPVIRLWQGTYLIIHWGWLLCLPLIGALGAYWSRRAGGKLLDRVLAASLYALALTCAMPLGFCIGLVSDFGASLRLGLVGFVVDLLGYGIAPFLLLLLGALPFLRGHAAESQQATASH
jgi:hypothetical protein